MEPRRHVDETIRTHVGTLREIVVLLGARQVGKTTLLRRLFPQARYHTVDNEHVRRILNRYDISAYRQLIPVGTPMVILDELHLLKDPGRAAKILYDQMPQLKLIVTGSSAFWIKNRATESLAGRKIDYYLYPLTVSEYLVQSGITDALWYPFLQHVEERDGRSRDRLYPFDAETITDTILRYGLYPATLGHPRKEAYLTNLVDSVVFRDLMELSLIENRTAARNLLRLLAYQIGSLVSSTELAARLSIDVKTVQRYLALFEQSYILFSVPPFRKSGRKEIGKMSKIYFFDCGLRNALIENFRPVEERGDKGALFENLVMAEVWKANRYGNFGFTMHYWRTTDGSEVDLILVHGDRIVGYEIKSSPRPTYRPNRAFLHRYPRASLGMLTPGNYL